MRARYLVLSLGLLAGCGSRSGLLTSDTTAAGGAGGSGGLGGTGGSAGSGGGGADNPCPAGSGVVELTKSTKAIRGLAVDATNVYFSTTGGEVFRVEKSGAGAGVLATPGGDIRNVAERGGDLFIAGSNGVFRIDKQSGASQSIAGGDGYPWDADFDGDQVFFTAYYTGSIAHVTPQGGTPLVIADNLYRPFELVLDGTWVYFTANGEDKVERVPKAGGSVETLADAKSSPWGIAVDETSVYWSEACGSTCGRIVKASKAGGPPSVLADGLDSPTGIALDATRVFWITFATSGPKSSSVSAVEKTSGPVTSIASGIATGEHVALDGRCVYWVQSDGGVFRAPKP